MADERDSFCDIFGGGKHRRNAAGKGPALGFRCVDPEDPDRAC